MSPDGIPAHIPVHQDDDHSAERPLVELDTDLTEDAQFGVRKLVVTSTAVVVSEPGGATLLHIPIADIESARNEPLVSGGRMEIKIRSGEILVAAYYSQSLAHKFSEAARGIEQLAKSREFAINLDRERTRCIKCDRLLPEKGGICPACVNKTKTLLRIIGFLGPYRKQAALLMGLSILATVLNLAPPVVQRNIIDNLNSPERNYTYLLSMVGVWLVILVCTINLMIVNGRMMAYLAAHISADLRAATFRSIEFLKINYFDRKPTGAIVSRVTQDTDRIWHFLVDGLPFFVTNALILVGVAGFLLYTNWLLAVCILAPLPIVACISVFAWRPLSHMFHRVSQRMARMHMHLNESLSGIRVVKAFVKEDHEHQRFLERNHAVRDMGVLAEQRWVTAFGYMSFFINIGMLIFWAVGGWFVFTDRMTLGEFWMVFAYLGMVYGPLQWFAQINNWFSRAMAGAERVFEVIDMVPEPVDTQGSKNPIEGRVEFEEVRFGYDKSNPVLKGVSFEAQPGEMIGLVGHSGAGKSTTINLIARFYDPDSGRILIDGVDFRELDLHHYRSQIGIVLQEPYLFNGTISENIAYGKPGALFAEIVAAARAANAHDFILGKPDGYDTVVGERGGRLSGGERQRISIARAILHNPRILILDEATSSVDVETERQIQDAIAKLIQGRTTFAIAHRLSTLRNANRLIVLERGEIAEVGTHEELMAMKGSFYKLVQTQSAINEIIGVGVVHG